MFCLLSYIDVERIILNNIQSIDQSLFDIQVSILGDTLWVAGHDGSCIARFSKRFGIDVHTTVEDQMKGVGQCLYCTHEPAGQSDWDRFRAEVSNHHGIEIPAEMIVF